MLLLAIDAATRFSGLALLEGEQVLAEYLLQSNRTHSQRLLPAIDLLLRDLGRSIDEVEALAVSKGPGSFTGLRIGMSLAKGMAQALQVPLLGISSLQHWAAALAPCIPEKALLLPLLDAGRGEFYSALYRRVGSELYEEQPEAARSGALLVQLAERFAGEGMFLTGDVLPKREAELRQLFADKVHFAEAHLTLPRPAALGLLALRRLRRGESDHLFALTPQYLRLSEAERKRLQNEQNEETKNDDLPLL